MGGQRLKTSTSPFFEEVEEKDNTSYTQVFDEVFPYYLSIGMSREEFWDMDAELVKAYRKADQYRLDRKNMELWLQGMYVYEAIIDVAPVLQAFAKRGTKVREYAKEPYKLRPEKNEAKIKQNEMRNKMEDFARKFNKNFEKRKEEGRNGN